MADNFIIKHLNEIYVIIGITAVLVATILNNESGGYHHSQMYNILQKITHNLDDPDDFKQKFSYAITPFYTMQYVYNHPYEKNKINVMNNIQINNGFYLVKEHNSSTGKELHYCYGEYKVVITESYNDYLGVRVSYTNNSECLMKNSS